MIQGIYKKIVVRRFFREALFFIGNFASLDLLKDYVIK